MNDDDRISYLSGESDVAGRLDDDERRALDDVRDLLADPSMWAEPPADLGDSIVAEIRAESGQAVRSSSLPPPSAVGTSDVVDLGEERRRRRPSALLLLGAALAV